jgi:hypothetical protein
MNTACDVFKRNLINGTEIVISVDDAINELSNYYDIFTLEERFMKGEMFTISDYVYEGAPYTID